MQSIQTPENRPPPLRRMPPPLAVAADMSPRWLDVDLDFDSAAEELVHAHESDGLARDLPILDLRTWGVVPMGTQMALAPLAAHRPPLPLRANAFGNLAARLGAPAEFVRERLPAPLQLATLNYLLATQDDPMSVTLRARGGEISALVSARYAPLDAVELVDTVRGTLRDLGLLGAVRARSVASGLVDVLRLVFPAESRAVRVGDVTALGIDISTSSFGRSAVHIRGLLWRLRCTNGLRVREGVGSISMRHVGDGDRLRAGIAEAIPSVFAHAQGAMTRWQNAVRFMIDDVAAQVAALQDLTQAEQKLVTEEIRLEAGTPALPERVDAFTFLNGITAAARSAVPSRRLELESLAGRLLDQRVPS